MEKNNGYKVIAIVALVISVVALSIGFATFTATLNIQNATAVVNPSNTFTPNVQYKQGSLSCVKTGTAIAVTSVGEFNDATHATIWQNAAVTVADGPGSSVTCTATVQNNSTFTLYLKEIKVNSDLSCEPLSAGDTVQNLPNACHGMRFTVKVGSNESTASDSTHTATTSVSDISIPAGQEGEVEFTVQYLSGSAVTDGDFRVILPTVEFVSDTDAPAQNP